MRPGAPGLSGVDALPDEAVERVVLTRAPFGPGWRVDVDYGDNGDSSGPLYEDTFERLVQFLAPRVCRPGG